MGEFGGGIVIRPPTATRERCQLLSNDRIFSREVVQQGCSRSRDYDGTMIEDEHHIELTEEV